MDEVERANEAICKCAGSGIYCLPCGRSTHPDFRGIFRDPGIFHHADLGGRVRGGGLDALHLGITFDGDAGPQRTARMTELQLLAFVVLPVAIVAVAYAALRYREHRIQVVQQRRATKG